MDWFLFLEETLMSVSGARSNTMESIVDRLQLLVVDFRMIDVELYDEQRGSEGDAQTALLSKIQQ